MNEPATGQEPESPDTWTTVSDWELLEFDRHHEQGLRVMLPVEFPRFGYRRVLARIVNGEPWFQFEWVFGTDEPQSGAVIPQNVPTIHIVREAA